MVRALVGLIIAGVALTHARCAPEETLRVGNSNEEKTEKVEGRATASPLDGGSPSALRFRVVARWPHDPQAFTQGLVWNNGELYESVGLYGRSQLRRVTLETGVPSRVTPLIDQQFAEGLALAGEELVQLTWRERVALRYRRDSFASTGTYAFDGEGWGLTFDGESFWMSDGSSIVRRRDRGTFRSLAEIPVTEGGAALSHLNELEWIEGSLWANVWMSDRIVRIDPESGRVTGSLDLSGILSASERSAADVLNGIAWVPERRTFLITGKLWPTLFEIEILE